MARIMILIAMLAALFPLGAHAQAGPAEKSAETKLNSEPIPTDLADILAPVAPKFNATPADASQLRALVADPKVERHANRTHGRAAHATEPSGQFSEEKRARLIRTL